MRFRLTSLLLSVIAACAAADQAPAIPPEVKATLDRIRPNSLKGHLSFLASDLLEGRGTPSRGLDLAAEYIAAQFRRAGLEPAGDQGYFQNAPFLLIEPVTDGLALTAAGVSIPADKLTATTSAAISLRNQTPIKWGEGQDVTGKVVLLHATDFPQLMAARRQMTKPALLIVTGNASARFQARRPLIPAGDRPAEIPMLSVRDEKFAARIQGEPAGPVPFQVDVTIPAPVQKQVTLRNVVGVLRGSDPVLKDTFVMVTSHYDHLGLKADGEGDRIFSGANDDASGTVSVIEIASALSSAQHAPKRSIIFAAFFGEELGLLGSRYYGAHPSLPLLRTVADVNLEHMGRTDSDLGPHVGMVNFTGFDFSDVPAVFKKAGELTGIEVVKDVKNSDAFFSRSDNQAMADKGVPAHTISVAYEFPDYHKVGDKWDKVDYENMAAVDRMVALGLLMIADNPHAPQWNEAEPKAKKYRDAARKLGQ